LRVGARPQVAGVEDLLRGEALHAHVTVSTHVGLREAELRAATVLSG
jgi:hypothetical protein